MQSEYVDDPDEMLREAREADEARREYDRLQDAFYAESIGWSNADKRRDYAAMLNHIRAGIATTLPFIESRRTPEYNDWMPWIPWFLPKSGVVLALYNATELLDNVERLKDVLGSEGIEAATYREMAARFEDIRRFVQAEGETSLEALKTAIPSVGADTHRLVDWLGKNRELSYWKGDDGKALIRWGRPTEAPREAGRAFRAGSKSVVAPNVDISFSRAPLGTDDWYHSVLTEQPALTSWERMLEAPRAFRDSRLLPAEDRLPGIMRNVAVGAESWLIGRAKRASDASHRTAVIVKAADGKTVTGLTLDHKAHRVGASVDGDHLVTIDERLILRVIHASQAEVLRISLEHTPEVQETVQREWNPDGDLPDVTAFDVNVPAKQLVYAIEGRVYRFGFDGRLISAFEVPLRPSYDAWWGEHGAPTKIAAVLDRIGRSTNITGRQAASIVPNLPFGRRNQPEVEAAMVAAGAHRGKAITKREQGGVWRLANLMGQLARRPRSSPSPRMANA